MAEERTFPAWVNPLAFHEVEEPRADKDRRADHSDVVKYLCTPGTDVTVDALVGRYNEVSKEPTLSVVPAEANILEKLIWPLRNAKASYMVGNYLGTIALCGMVAEMVAILLFEIAEIKLDDKPMDEEAQRRIFGSAVFVSSRR